MFIFLMTMFAEQSEIGDESYTLDLNFIFYVNFKLTIKLSPIVNEISRLTHLKVQKRI